MASAHFQERSGDPPHHSPEEGGPNHFQDELAGPFQEVNPPQRPDGVLDGGVKLFGIGSEVVGSDERGRGLPHPGQVQRPAEFMDVARPMGIARSNGDPVPVGAVLCTESGVEPGRNSSCADDREVGR